MTAPKESSRKPLQFKNRADFMRHITVGTEIVATAHANHPDLVGLPRIVTKVQTVGFYTKVKGQPDHKWSTCNNGEEFMHYYEKEGK